MLKAKLRGFLFCREFSHPLPEIKVFPLWKIDMFNRQEFLHPLHREFFVEHENFKSFFLEIIEEEVFLF
jgi:hypothetical protein